MGLKAMQSREHIILAFKIILVLILTLLALRTVTVPVPYGKFDVFQEKTIQNWLNEVPLEYVGANSCKASACHRDQIDLVSSSRHKDISCESCHAVAVGGVEEKPVDCMICHTRLRARPENFPQITKTEHYPEQRCVKCHDPHAPIPMMSHPMPVARKGRQACLICHLEPAGEMQELTVPGISSEFEYLFRPPKKEFEHGGEKDCISCHTISPSLAELATMVHGKDVSYCPRCHRAGGLAQGDFR